jgi:hypothetical protein
MPGCMRGEEKVKARGKDGRANHETAPTMILRHFRHLSKSFGNHAQQQQQQDLNLGLGTYCGLPPVGWVHI